MPSPESGCGIPRSRRALHPSPGAEESVGRSSKALRWTVEWTLHMRSGPEGWGSGKERSGQQGRRTVAGISAPRAL